MCHVSVQFVCNLDWSESSICNLLMVQVSQIVLTINYCMTSLVCTVRFVCYASEPFISIRNLTSDSKSFKWFRWVANPAALVYHYVRISYVLLNVFLWPMLNTFLSRDTTNDVSMPFNYCPYSINLIQICSSLRIS